MRPLAARLWQLVADGVAAPVCTAVRVSTSSMAITVCVPLALPAQTASIASVRATQGRVSMTDVAPTSRRRLSTARVR